MRKLLLTILQALLIFTLALLPPIGEARAVNTVGPSIAVSAADSDQNQSPETTGQVQTITSTDDKFNSLVGFTYSVPGFIYNCLPSASATCLPRWRGFNLLEKFQGSRLPYSEDDFKWISELGFNFVRLPIDYHSIINNGDVNTFDDNAIKDIDQAIAWGQKYNIHVCLAFHRAPGYCILAPAEPFNLWTDPEPQQLLVKYWAFFARRYKGIPNSQLSFNLINEPDGVSNQNYAKVIGMLCKAIRQEDPNRLIIADSIEGYPVPELAGLDVAQSARSYRPLTISHYRASWADVNNDYPTPQWPMKIVGDNIYGPLKPLLVEPLTIAGNFRADDQLTLQVGIISNFARFQFKADGKVFFDSGTINCTTGSGPWKKTVYLPQWNIYQNVFDLDYTAALPVDTKEIEIVMVDGDWLSFNQITIKTSSSPGQTIEITPTTTEWGLQTPQIVIDHNGNYAVTNSLDSDKAGLQQGLAPWIQLKNQDTGIMVGEFGCYNQTSHDVALSWMRDNLDIWKGAGIGWALWNFRGPFGILDSGRNDVQYENFHGHELDRAMLTLLQQS